MRRWLYVLSLGAKKHIGINHPRFQTILLFVGLPGSLFVVVLFVEIVSRVDPSFLIQGDLAHFQFVVDGGHHHVCYFTDLQRPKRSFFLFRFKFILILLFSHSVL